MGEMISMKVLKDSIGEIAVINKDLLDTTYIRFLEGVDNIKNYDSPVRFVIEGTTEGGAITKNSYNYIYEYIKSFNPDNAEELTNTVCEMIAMEGAGCEVDGFKYGYKAGIRDFKIGIAIGALGVGAVAGATIFFKSEKGKKFVDTVKGKFSKKKRENDIDEAKEEITIIDDELPEMMSVDYAKEHIEEVRAEIMKEAEEAKKDNE